MSYWYRKVMKIYLNHDVWLEIQWFYRKVDLEDVGVNLAQSMGDYELVLSDHKSFVDMTCMEAMILSYNNRKDVCIRSINLSIRIHKEQCSLTATIVISIKNREGKDIIPLWSFQGSVYEENIQYLLDAVDSSMDTGLKIQQLASQDASHDIDMDRQPILSVDVMCNINHSVELVDDNLNAVSSPVESTPMVLANMMNVKYITIPDTLSLGEHVELIQTVKSKGDCNGPDGTIKPTKSAGYLDCKFPHAFKWLYRQQAIRTMDIPCLHSDLSWWLIVYIVASDKALAEFFQCAAGSLSMAKVHVDCAIQCDANSLQESGDMVKLSCKDLGMMNQQYALAVAVQDNDPPPVLSIVPPFMNQNMVSDDEHHIPTVIIIVRATARDLNKEPDKCPTRHTTHKMIKNVSSKQQLRAPTRSYNKTNRWEEDERVIGENKMPLSKQQLRAPTRSFNKANRWEEEDRVLGENKCATVTQAET
ncbi:hypothetical protein DFJ58DRAFT_848843 [Suillus subalutaceus]|uniref:uncharacterized protein n=1 Tax=Suillus subalutaceus TaxID=48586 RepID=UPI001B886A24|nr:uncharacterized protein DFJ58DRAFT_848843 [Suillus subalutaceus]KAG1829045.1 hypothetical protein DFJ58DRAFT_848843 [Suillus subalutaceus]